MGANAFRNIMARLDWQMGDQKAVYDQIQTDNNQNLEQFNDTQHFNTQDEPQEEKFKPQPQHVEEAQNGQVIVKEEPIVEDNRSEWESGQPDYKGKASFDLILKRIEASTKPEVKEEPEIEDVEDESDDSAIFSPESETVQGPKFVTTGTQTVLSTLAPYHAYDGSQRRVLSTQSLGNERPILVEKASEFPFLFCFLTHFLSLL